MWADEKIHEIEEMLAKIEKIVQNRPTMSLGIAIKPIIISPELHVFGSANLVLRNCQSFYNLSDSP